MGIVPGEPILQPLFPPAIVLGGSPGLVMSPVFAGKESFRNNGDLFERADKPETIEGHHLFPKKFRDFFDRNGIDVDDYILPLSKDRHRLKSGNGVHTGKQSWNKVWKDWIIDNPNPKKGSIFGQVDKMRKDFGI